MLKGVKISKAKEFIYRNYKRVQAKDGRFSTVMKLHQYKQQD